MKIDRKSAISLQRGKFDPKFQVQGVAPTHHFYSQKTRLNGLSYGIKICTDLSSVLSQCTRLTERWADRYTTDGQTEFSSLNRGCIPCSEVKTYFLTKKTFKKTFKKL